MQFQKYRSISVYRKNGVFHFISVPMCVNLWSMLSKWREKIRTISYHMYTINAKFYDF